MRQRRGVQHLQTLHVSAGCERERGLNDLALCNLLVQRSCFKSIRPRAAADWTGLNVDEGVLGGGSEEGKQPSRMPRELCPEFADVVEERYQILLLLKLLPGTCRKLCTRYELLEGDPNLIHPHSHPITHIHSPLASPPRVLLPADPALHHYLHSVPHLHAHMQLAPHIRTATALTRRWCRAECRTGGKCGGSE